MIFITLGSQKFQFDRLLKAVDYLVKDKVINEDIFAQVGYSDYVPKHYSYKQFLDRNEYMEKMNECDLVITHGGTGAIVGAIKRGKRVIAVPRLNKFGEHVDDHQVQIVNQFTDMNLICGIMDTKDLENAIDEVRREKYNEYKSNTNVIISSIEKYIDEI